MTSIMPPVYVLDIQSAACIAIHCNQLQGPASGATCVFTVFSFAILSPFIVSATLASLELLASQVNHARPVVFPVWLTPSVLHPFVLLLRVRLCI